MTPDQRSQWFTTLFDSRPSLVTNSFFNNSQLKPRIQMLVNPETNRRALWTYTLMLPLLAILTGLTVAREQLTETLESQPGKTITVSGRVVDAGGKPLVGASVMDGHRMTTVDSRGYYTLTEVTQPAKIMFGHVGYDPQLCPVNRAGMLNVTLRRTREELPKVGATAAYKAVGINKAMPTSADPVSTTVNDREFIVVEQKPEFPDGIPGLMYYVAHALHYPAEAQRANVQGTVFVKFVVTAAGLVNGVRVVKGLGKGCDQEAVRVVSQMPKWKPAKQYGRPVSVEYVLPVQFALEKHGDARTGYIEMNKATTNKVANVLQTNSAPQSTLEIDGGPAVIIYKKPGEDGPAIFVDGKEKDKDFDVSTIRSNAVDSVAGFFPPFTSDHITNVNSTVIYKYGIIRIYTKAKKQ